MLFSILLMLFILCCAIVIDVGYWWAAAKKAQVAADACALAAAQSIPGVDPSSGAADPTTGECMIEGAPDYVLTNLPDQSGSNPNPVHTGTIVEWPYVDNAAVEHDSMVEARVELKVGIFFGRIVRHPWVLVRRRAVAERLDSEGNMAIFSYSDDCAGNSLLFNAENVFINGFVHSNGRFRVDTGPFWAADGTTNTPNCPSSVDSDVEFAQFGEDRPPPWGDDCEGVPCRLPRDGVFEDWPEWYTPSQFGWLDGCDYYGQTIEVDSTHLKIKDQTPVPLPPDADGTGTIVPSGTYCATEWFKIGGNDHRGAVTALAPDIQVGGVGHDFTPHESGVLFFAVPNSDMNFGNDGPLTNPGGVWCDVNVVEPLILNNDRSTWTGVIFNPCEEVVVNNNDSIVGNNDLVGTILGFKVRINGCCFEMIGTGESNDDVELALVE